MSSTRALKLVVACLYVMWPGSVQSASLIGLGGLGEDFVTSTAYAISKDGRTIVGNSAGRAFVWTSESGMSSLGLGNSAADFTPVHARDVSADGSVVVGDGFGASGREAFAWSASGGVRPLGDLPGGRHLSIAFGIDPGGGRPVGQGLGEDGSDAVLWDLETGGLVGIGAFPGIPVGSIAHDATRDAALVVGVAQSSSGFGEAFVWDAATRTMRGLGSLPGGGLYSEAVAVTSDGATVVGRSGSGNAPEGSGSEAFVWDAERGMRGLGDLPGSVFHSEALDVSDDGQTVVGFSVTEATSEAFLWRPETGMQSLQVLLVAMGVDLGGWHLRAARGISADGTRIVGEGVNPDGVREAFLAVIPEPSALIMIGAGLTLLASRPRRSRCFARPSSGRGRSIRSSR